MEFKYENEYLHPRVKLCILLNKFIKQTGVNQDITNVVVAKECFALLSKQILAIQLKQRMLGQNAVLEINDNDFYLAEYKSNKEFGTSLYNLIPELIYPSFVEGDEHFEESLKTRLFSLLTSLSNNLLKTKC